MRGVDHDQCIAVGCRLRDDISADHTAGTGPVVNDHLLAEFGAQLHRHDAPEHVGTGTRRVRYDHADGPHRILRVCRECQAACRAEREHYSARMPVSLTTLPHLTSSSLM